MAWARPGAADPVTVFTPPAAQPLKIHWLPGPAYPALVEEPAQACAHVWCVDLDDPATADFDTRALLSPDEIDRADRFVRDVHRRRYCAAHAALRWVLSQYTRLPPRDLEFVRNPYGKPALSDAQRPAGGQGNVQFNLAHSERLGLIAVAWGQPVGVDVEYWREDYAWQPIARRFFSPAENAALDALPPECQYAGFLNGWTRKEAYIKAKGAGLYHPLDSFDVSLAPDQPAALLAVRDNSEHPAGWLMQALDPAPGYVAALALSSPGGREVRCWQAVLDATSSGPGWPMG